MYDELEYDKLTVEEKKILIEEENKNARDELLNRMKGINWWISKNPNVTEPNMYEMLDCVTKLGVHARREEIAQSPNKFPDAESELSKVYVEWNKMHRARLSWERVQSSEFSVNKNTSLYAYYADLNMRCCTGEFRFPGMDVKEEELTEEERKAMLKRREEFLECVKKIGSISLYINQERAHNPNFVYDNQEEYNKLMAAVEEYEEYLPAYSDRVISDISASRVIEQPQNPGGDDEPSL